MEYVDCDCVVKEFCDGLMKIFIVIDVLLCGLDVSMVIFVINYDMSVEFYNLCLLNYEMYLYCIGCSGWFGKKGVVFNLILGDFECVICD